MDSTEDDAIVHTPIENLGGGDAWLAGFIDALSEHGHGPVSPLIGALRGDLLSALCQNTVGDVSMVTREELDSFESQRNFTSEKQRILTIPSRMGLKSTLAHLKEAGVVAILRGQNRNRMIERGVALAEMGCTAIEVTLDSPEALEIGQALRQQLPSSVMIGVGTLLDVGHVQSCIDIGAEFALSPTHPDGMVERCHAANMLAVPGVANSQELEQVIASGAHIAKLFPSTDWDPEQLSSVTLPWMPVGGVDEQSVWQWLDAGAWCVGMGSNLCGSDLSDSDDAGNTWAESEEQVARGIFMELQRRRSGA